ncbi:TRAP transporter large permease subunit, partial [Bacteroides thetaiotaomicron]
MVLVIAFFALLLLGIPIALVVLIASTMGIAAYSGTSLQIVTQFLFSGLNNYVLLAIPFFIMSGTIASRGNT